MSPFGEYEPEPRRNPLAVCFDLALAALVGLVFGLALFGKLDWLLDLADLFRR